jgi:hypothetical protein
MRALIDWSRQLTSDSVEDGVTLIGENIDVHH